MDKVFYPEKIQNIATLSFFCALVLLIIALPASLLAQAPTISYTTPHTYTVNTTIAPLTPTGSGVGSPAYSNPNTFKTFLTVPWGLASDQAGNVYVSNILGGVAEIPAGGGTSKLLASGFTDARGLAVDAAGNVYVADYLGNTVSKIDAVSGTVTSIGTGFNGPTGVAVDASGNVFVSDFGNNAIKEILASDGSTVIVGSGFSGPTGIAIDGQGSLYVADYGNNAIKKVLLGSNVVSTLVLGLDADNGIAVDGSGNIFYSSDILQTINEIPAGSTTPITLATGLSVPHGITVDGADNVYYDTGLLFINQIKPVGGYFVSPALPAGLSINNITGVISGTPTAASPATNYTVTAYNVHGSSNKVINITVSLPVPAIASFSPATAGTGQTVTIVGSGFTGATAVSFGGTQATSFNVISDNEITAVVGAGASGSVTVTTPTGTNSLTGFIFATPPVINYVTPQVYTVNTSISPLAPTNTGGAVPANVYAQVSTFAGGSSSGYTNGTGTAARFGTSYAVATDLSGNIYVADYGNNLIREITPAGVVTTLAGNGAAGSTNATGTAASFNVPYGVTADAAGNIYVADENNSLIRKITPSGVVTTLAGKNGITGSTNATGTAASFNHPFGVATDAAGNVYVADYMNNLIREITPAGVVTTLAGSGSQGANNATGAAASFFRPDYLCVDAAGNVYVMDNGNNLIRKITPGGVVTTFAGTLTPGLINGTGTAASFSQPTAITMDAQGNIYVADQGNSLIRKVTPAGIVTTFAGSTSGVLDGIGTAAKFQAPNGIAIDANGNLYLTDLDNYLIRKISTTGYTISPALPAGLTFDATTGTIGGTPTATSPATDYTITAYNLVGSSTTTVNITIKLAAPTITSISPSTGPVGTLVTVTGTNLTNPTTFTIGGVTAIAVSGTSTQLVGMVMPGAVTGNVAITTGGGTASSTGNFTVTATPFPALQQGNKLVGNSASGSAFQGQAVSISADGNTAIVGGSADNSNKGAAWIYTRSGGAWTQQGGKLVGTGATGNASQGISVSISADGNTAIVGGQNDNSGVGAVWIYTRSGGVWTQQGAKLVASDATGAALQGSSVAISADGNTVIAGGPGDNSSKGAAWIYTRTGGVWTQYGTKLVGTGATGAAGQGYSVSLSADASTSIIGGYHDNANSGAAWVFIKNSGTWTQQGTKLFGSGGTGAGEQGYSVALNADGNTAIVGAFRDNTNKGAAFVYTRTGGTWTQQGAKLFGTGSVGSTVNQGSAVSLSADGNTGLVGGNFDGFSHTGATWVYTRSGSTWTQQGTKLVGTVSTSSSQGQAICISADGTTTIAGGPTDVSNTGAAWIYIPGIVPPSTIATLSNLAISPGTLTPVFNSGTTTYSDNVVNIVTSVTVTPTVTDANATIKVNGATVASGSASSPIALTVGINTITTVVTAQDGTTTNTYKIIVTRAPSAVATLNNLAVSSGVLFPVFASGTTNYTDAVTNATSTITVTPTHTDANSTIKVNGITVASGSASGQIALAVGANTITTVVTAQDGTTTDTYKIIVTRAPSTVATLNNLAVSSGVLSPNFASGTTNYTDAVTNATSTITVTPTHTEANSTIKVNGTTVASGSASGPITLAVGANTITTVVTAQDGTTTDTYKIIVTRAPSAVATLSNLTVSSGVLSPTFASGTANYTDAVTNATSTITVTPTHTDANSTIKVNGTTVASGSASGPIALAVGANTITTVVTAQDGTTTNTYKIIVTRAPSAVATLNNLAISSGVLSPVFASGTTNYTDAVTNATSTITVTPTHTDANATIKVNGSIVASGSASNPIALAVGANTITTVVTAQDGTTTNTYKIIVTRAPSAVATLSNLTVSSGVLSPTFASGTANYTDAVTNTTSTITVTPTHTDANSTIKVNGTIVASGSASNPIALAVGTNTITTVVTAQDGTTTDTYKILVTRAPSAVATLSNLAVSSGVLSPNFASGTANYTDAVTNATSTITVTPTHTDANSTIKVNGITVASGSASGPIALAVGTNTITTVVTAQDGTTTNTYKILVTRAPSAIATLSNLVISSGTLSPTFAPGTMAYTDEVSNATSSVTVTPTHTDPNATIKVNGITVASGSASGPITLAVGTNTITTVVTAQNGTTIATYTTTVTRSPSSNAGLAGLSVSKGTLTPVFNTATGSYTDNVSNSVTSINVTPTVADATATIKVNGSAVLSGAASPSIALALGPNTINTVITAQDGVTTKTYTVVVNRALPAVATLANLAISNGVLSPAFASTTTGYTDVVTNTTTSVTVTPTLTDPAAHVTVNGTAVASGSAAAPIPLNVGPNTITSVVTAQDGTTIGTYSIVVTRAASSNAGLADLTVSSGTLSPFFATGTTNYTVAVTNATPTIKITPVTSDPTATVTVNGEAVTSGNTSGAIALNVGPNTIITVVTAQDGTKNTYTVIVNRAPSAIATLANLTISNGTLMPGFAPATKSYTDNVANSVSSVTVTPTAGDVTATITVNGISVISGNASGAIALNPGANTITTVITAQDGVTTATYTITVNRAASSDASLANLVVSSGILSPSFAAGTASYTDAVANSVTSITITATTSNVNATITVNGKPATSGIASSPISLNIGANTITTVVTAQDGTTTATYSIIVNRDKGTQTITFNALTDVTYGSADFDPGATASSGLPIVYSSSDATVVTIVNGKVHLTGTGTVTITAGVADNANYYPATPVSQPLTVVKADQTITTMTIPVLLEGTTIDLSQFTASSGLPVYFTLSDTSIAVIRGNTLVAKQIGTVTLTVYQPGNNFYNAAQSQYTIVTVTDAKDDELVVHPVVTPNGDGINDYFVVEGIKNYPDNSVVLANRNGVKIYATRGYDNESLRFDGHSNITGDFQPAGTYFYLIDYTANGEHKHKTGFIVLKY